MKFHDKDVPFPAQTKISFFKVIESFEAQAKDTDENVAAFAKNLLQEVEKYPVLKEGFDDFSILKQHQPVINKLLRTLYPDVLLTNEIKAVTPPFIFKPFFFSTRLKNIITSAGGEVDFEPKGHDANDMYILACSAIMRLHYHYPVDVSFPLYVEIPSKELGMTRTYRIAFNADLIEISPTEKSKNISREDYEQLMDNFSDIELWKEKFPPDSWVIRGIGIVNLTDVTLDQSITDITANLVIKSDAFLKIKQGIKTLFNNHNLQVGFIAYENDAFMSSPKENFGSILLREKEAIYCNDMLCDFSYRHLMELKTPLVISDVSRFDIMSKSTMSQSLKEQKIESFIAAPLIHEGELLGLLELAASNKYELNESSLNRLNMVLPILTLAASRFRDETRNRIEAIIHQECTTIHPSVKWRFEEEAYRYMYSQHSGEAARFKEIIFSDVYPLYGQLDIRDSSERRNDAVQADLITQINGVKKVLQKAFDKTQLPAYEELIFRIDCYKEEIEKGMLAGSEHRVQQFFKAEVYPVFEYLRQSDKILDKAVEAYDKMLDANLKFVYRERKKLDEVITEINHTLASFIDWKQQEAQQMFPHYFERYKTDGLEYNMYIGKSISRKRNFHPIYLHNLRLWQLLVMCEMENEFRHLQKNLESKLEIASLILVYGTPLSIHFRQDEKRFDVEGAYNARYEIVKKRVDKAFIQGTKERITQPGKIAIIYSSEQDALEYRKYIKFLQSKNYLKKDSLEDYELQDLQGITGLRALRVEVSYHEKNSGKEILSMEKIIEGIEKN
jgi:hypothetical protein